ncbi:MAG: peptidylprolyl isomerase [Patescibacteria group bacterium]|nr:peptidylprolyl isomerase [Patescibacteria group bacterium]
MSKRSRERKLRAIAEKQVWQKEIRERELARTAPMRSWIKRISLTLVGTLVIVMALLGSVSGIKYLVSGQMNRVAGPFGEISKEELAASQSLTLKTSEGDITVELDTQHTPKTAANFVLLAKQGFYNGVKFHRVIENFMIQSGDPNSKDDDPSDDGTGGPGYTFSDEAITGEYTRGTLAMANSGANTNGSQFFIMQADYDLPKNYVIFGHVTEGLDVVDKIATTPVENNGQGEESRPLKDIIVESVVINS